MKRTAVMLATLAGIVANAAPDPRLTVYVYIVTPVPVAVQVNAESMASTILRRASVSVNWRHGKLLRAYRGQPVEIEMAGKPATDHRSDEIGFAYTSDGVHIRVYYDQIKEAVAPNTVPYLLAYV